MEIRICFYIEKHIFFQGLLLLRFGFLIYPTEQGDFGNG